MLDDIELMQVLSEFDPLLAIYRDRAPRRILEVGSWQGGTLRAWLQESEPPPELVVAVDPNHQRPELYDGWRRGATELEVITGSSLDPAVQATLRRLVPFDWLFIDGDHTDHAVRQDVQLARELAGKDAVLVLHDIALGAGGNGWPDVARVFAELQAEGLMTERFVEEPYSGPWGHGIGVVYL